MTDIELSVIVISYNMARELPRTVHSLSPAMQRDIDPGNYEIIVIDNGSTEGFDADRLRCCHPNVAVHEFAQPEASPVAAINHGLAMARGTLIGVMIDGARLASPGLLRTSLAASRIHDRAVIGSLGFHLGPDVQMRSVPQGYDQAEEDRLLQSIEWQDNGYRLFEISSFAGSSANGWFSPIAESNALFLRRALWQELGGYDAGFRSPGGGLANLDIWVRACGLPGAQVIILLGEGTFHQVHGGVATNAARDMFSEFHKEYQSLRGHPFSAPAVEPLYLGTMAPPVLASIEWSAKQAASGTGRDRC